MYLHFKKIDLILYFLCYICKNNNLDVKYIYKEILNYNPKRKPEQQKQKNHQNEKLKGKFTYKPPKTNVFIN